MAGWRAAKVTWILITILMQIFFAGAAVWFAKRDHSSNWIPRGKPCIFMQSEYSLSKVTRRSSFLWIVIIYKAFFILEKLNLYWCFDYNGHFYFLLLMHGRESNVLGSIFLNWDFDGLTRFEGHSVCLCVCLLRTSKKKIVESANLVYTFSTWYENTSK